MFTVIVSLEVRPGRRAEFIEGIRANSRASRADEPGCVRFDVHQLAETPNRFLLHEVYTDEDAFYTAHRSGTHYAAWRRVVERCVVPGTQVNTYATPVFPEDIGVDGEVVADREDGVDGEVVAR